ncbi:hypothetical protein NEMBOFW57_010563 [Staphylotrichum longicolle]|uniref:Heterokaryon incompatibility domain-containing protein n=1 Tax=Staphylotrichum longicolle TaxID=669026 RepID=A0AAD4ENB4_9PEZI|nr:hypothetical protein NEMBOFW57_010563 [Staphylotrichum longicolle]
MSRPTSWGSDANRHQDLIRHLLHDSALWDPDTRSWCWRFSTLCQILTKERARNALRELWPEDEADRLAHEIAPLYETDEDAREKRTTKTPEKPERSLQIFAILVLMDSVKDIKKFIEANITDRDLPLETGGSDRWGPSHKPVLAIASAVDWLHNHETLSESPTQRGRFCLDEVMWFLSESRQKGEIRILNLLPGQGEAEIKCTVRVVPLSAAREYEALSYVWGEPSGSIPIQVQNHEVKVTRNLHAALRRLRNPTASRAIWIDQLCINQWDDTEKAEQVKLMRDIYKGCSQCLIWLGELPVAPESGFTLADAQTALSFLTDVSKALARPLLAIPSLLEEGPSADAARRAFRAMFMPGNVWWSRIWTVQEAILPPSTTVVWGSLTIPWDTLRKAATNLCAENATLTFGSATLRHAASRHDALFDSFMYPVRGLEISRKGESPLHMLHRWRYRDATDPRDKLYALTGLLPSIPGVECSYSTPAGELFTKLAVGLIEMEGSLRPLVGYRGEPHVTPGMPSWAWDLVSFSASVDRRLDFDQIFARGIFVDTIAEVGDILGQETWSHLTDETLITTIKRWERLLGQFMASKQSSSTGPYAGGGSADDAFWRTMLGNLIMAEFPVSVASAADRIAYTAFLEDGERNQIYESLRDMVINQAFFITTGGYIGVGPPNSEKGDEQIDGASYCFEFCCLADYEKASLSTPRSAANPPT